MTILSSIVSQGIKINNKITQYNKTDLRKQQFKTLKKLLLKAKNTEFGRTYSFESILLLEESNNLDLYQLYKKYVPIHDYSSIFKNWWSKGLNGNSDIFWPGQIEYFALSSGTSEASSKYIPVSKQMCKAMQKTGLKTISSLMSSSYADKLFQHEFLMIGGSTELTQMGSIFKGDLSGIQASKLPFWFDTFYRPGKEIASIKDWDKRIQQMVINAHKWDIGVIVGVPSWVKLLIEKIISHYKLNSIHELWPNLFLFIHSGVAFEPYKKSFQQLFTSDVMYLETYLASEGFIASEVFPDKTGLQINLKSGIFYEFIPFNDKNFDDEGLLRDDVVTLDLQDIELNTSYAILLSSCTGAWRYLIGDVVKFVTPEKMHIVGRTKQFLNLCGEHLSIDNLNNAIIETCFALDIDIIEYSVAGISYQNSFAHVWFVDSEKQLHDNEASDILQKIDESLCKSNDDYAVERNAGQIALFIYFIPREYFYEFLELTGNMGGQNKVPRVLKNNKLKQWINFLESKNNLPEILKTVK